MPVRDKAKVIRITKPEHMGMIPGLVRNRPEINTYGGPRQDRNKNWIITMGRQDGGYSGHLIVLWMPREVTAREAEALVRQALGWEA